MKSSYLLFIVVLLCSSAFAQSGSRVVSFQEFNTDTTGTPRIFGNYVYSNGNGGQMFIGMIEPCIDCDYPITVIPQYDYTAIHPGCVIFDTAWQITDSDTARTIHTFAGHNISSGLIQNSYAGSGGIWYNNATSAYIYDVYNNILQQTNQVWSSGTWVNADQYIFTYDIANRPISEIYQRWDSTGWNNDFETLYTYNSDGDPIVFEYKNWISGNWQKEEKRCYYYTTGTLDSFVRFFAQVIGGDTIYTHENVGYYYYSSAGDTVILNNTYGTDTFFRVINTYDAHKNTTLRAEYALDPTLTGYSSNKWDYSYNANNKLTTEYYYDMDTSGRWAFSGLNRFSYEAYTPAGIKAINEDAGHILVYPSPAQNMVTIKLNWAESLPFSMSIYDNIGRVVRVWKEPAMTSCTKTIVTAGIPNGNYIIKATNGAEEQTGRFVVGN